MFAAISTDKEEARDCAEPGFQDDLPAQRGGEKGMRFLVVSCSVLALCGWVRNASADETALPAEPVAAPAWSLLTGWDVEVDYLMWYLRRDFVPGLVTTGSADSNGVPGHPDTRTVYGDERLETRHNDRFFGTRLRLAKWLDEERTVGVEGRAVFLERDSTYFTVEDETGELLLARPFIDARTGRPSSEVFAGPTAPGGPRSGAFNGYSRVELFTEEANVLCNLAAGRCYALDAIVGARFLQMRDRLDLTAASASLPDGATVFGLEDHYRIHDAFYGAQVGLRGEASAGPWFAQFRGTTALGANDQRISTTGYRITHTPEVRIVEPIGLTVQPSNRGHFGRCALDWMFDVGINVGCRLGRHLRVFAGYTLLYWDNPIRSGRQVDLVVNPVPGVASDRPRIPFRTEAIWGQGVSAGLELTW